jgi:hypothetical protein
MVCVPKLWRRARALTSITCFKNPKAFYSNPITSRNMKEKVCQYGLAILAVSAGLKPFEFWYSVGFDIAPTAAVLQELHL